MTVHSTSRLPSTRAHLVDPCTEPSWRALTTGARGSLFGAPPWLSAISATYGIDMRAAVVLAGDGTPRAGFAFAVVEDIRGRRVVSLPFCERIDPVAGDREWDLVLAPALAEELPIEVRVLDDGAAVRRDGRFRIHHELAWHATELGCDDEALARRFRGTARRNIRTAEREGVRVSVDSTLDDVARFHSLHLTTRKRKYGLLAQPHAFFEQVWRNFAPNGDIVVALATHAGDVVAGMLCLQWDGVMYYKFGASLPDRLAVRPNELLARECLRLASERGCHLFDWGVSDLDQPGLVAYKRKFATREKSVCVLRHEPDGWPSAGGGGDALLASLTELLTREDVPDDVTRRGGELLYRFFC